MKMTNRYVSLLLAVVMLIGMLPVTVLAAQTNTETENDSNSSISIGEYISLGTYHGEPIIWRCVDIDENGPLMLSDKILCFKAFDANGEDDYYHIDDWGYIRKERGSNCWSDSSIRQWLNSADSTVSYSHCPPTSASVTANGYADESGFLYGFSEEDLSAIKSVTQSIIINYQDTEREGYCDGGTKELADSSLSILESINDYSVYYHQFVSDKIFFLSAHQMVMVNKNISGYLEYAYPTEVAAAYAGLDLMESSEQAYEFWTAIPNTVGASFQNVRTGPTLDSHAEAYDGTIGVRPAFYLNTEAPFNKVIPEKEEVPPDVELNGHGYKLFSNCSTWDQAKVYCESVGGYLATITSEEENQFLYNYMISQGIESAYFGLSDSEQEGVWEWVTGESVSYTNWGPDEPNNENSNEDYGLFWYQYTNGEWNDGNFGHGTYNDGNPIQFICEWGDTTQYRLELSSAAEELSVPTGAQLKVTCCLYYGDDLVTDWEQPSISIRSGSLSIVKCDPVENGYCLTVQAYNIGPASIEFNYAGGEATLTVPVNVISDVGEDDHLRKEWIRQHMEYAASEEYQAEIVAGYRGKMQAVFDDTMSDVGIKAYDLMDALVRATDGKAEGSQADVYELLLAELMYASLKEDAVHDMFEENYYQAFVDVMDALLKGMENAPDGADLIKSMYELLNTLKTMDKKSPEFADTANKLSSLVNQNFTPEEVLKKLRSGAAATGLDIALDGALEGIDTCHDILIYANNSVAYSYTSDDFVRVMNALANKVSHELGPEDFPELSKFKSEIYWEELEKALRSFTASLDAQKSGKAADVGQYAVERMKEGAVNFAGQTLITLGTYGLKSIISCVPVLGQINMGLELLGKYKSAAELLTEIDEQSYRLDMLTKLYCLSVALDSVADDFAQDLDENYFWKSTAFDEAVSLYKAAQLRALEYMIEYEKTLLSDAYWQREDSWSKTEILEYLEEEIARYDDAIRNLEGKRKEIENISCHDPSLKYDPASDEIIISYHDAGLYVIACPVSVTILSETGEQIAYLSNDACEAMPGHELYFQTVELDENESIKLAFIPEGYQVIIDGESTGSMDVFITNAQSPMQYVLDIPVTADFAAEIMENEDGVLRIESNRIGDFTYDAIVDDTDVEYLLWNTLFEALYPIEGKADFNGDGLVNDADVEYLLWHTLFPDLYPL